MNFQKNKVLMLLNWKVKKYYNFYVNNENKIIVKILRIYGNKLFMNLLHSNDINKYFIDCTYLCVPAGLESANSLLLLIDYNIKYDLYELSCI